MTIKWTPRLQLRRPSPPAAELARATKQSATGEPTICPRTMNYVRMVINHALALFPEAAKAVSNTFLALIRGEITIDCTQDPAMWTLVDSRVPSP